MAVVGLGIDAVEVDRFARILARRQGAMERFFTDRERADSHGSAASLAARFAAKEAAMKALGVGLGAFGFHDVSIARAETGRPDLVVVGRAAELAAAAGGTRWHVSLTHTTLLAEAVVLLESP